MMEHGRLGVEIIVTGPIGENCYLLHDRETNAGLLIDPGADEKKIMHAIEHCGAQVKQIVGTHAHIDHLGVAASLQRRLSAVFSIHADEKQWLRMLPQQAEFLGFPPTEIPVVDRELHHGDEIMVGNRRGTVLHTPGHTTGGIGLHFIDEKVVFVGDTLFEESIGRTDLPGGSHQQIVESIRSQLFSLDD